MADAPPSLVDDDHRLRFACACASAVPIAEDPWVAIVNQRKLNDGTKERILNAIYRQPRTITQLAELLGISAPAVHRHVVDMLADELIQEVDLAAPSGAGAASATTVPISRSCSPLIAPRCSPSSRTWRPTSPRPSGGGRRRSRTHSPTRACPPAGNRSRCCSTISTPRRPAWPGRGWRRMASCRRGPSMLTARAGSGGRRKPRKRRCYDRDALPTVR